MIDWTRKALNILLVGEGNFTFTIALMKKAAIHASKSMIHVLSSCYEPYKELSENVKRNAKEANYLGAEIWFCVDATKLHAHERIHELKFDFIIFNFPHVGGKMKIHLNKALLKNFFESASRQLADNGEIVVSLCQGQSGTPYDSPRNFNDTWQIITMATFGCLILKRVMPFDSKQWPEYYCKGYRSLDKGFHLVGAKTYAFVKSVITISDSIFARKSPSFCDGVSHCSYIRNHLQDSSQGYPKGFPETSLFRLYFSSLGKEFVEASYSQHICLCSQNPNFIYDSVLKFSNFILASFIVCQPCNSVGYLDPVQRIVAFSLPLAENAQRFLMFLRSHNGIQSKVFAHLSTVEYRDDNNKLVLAILKQLRDRWVICIYLDELLKMIRHFPIGLDKFPIHFNQSTKSLYPPRYCHHLSFWTSPTFCDKKFACIVRQAGGALVRSLELIDKFHCEKSNRESLCYRIDYQSLDGALSRDLVWHVHINVISRFVEQCFDVTIR